MIQALISGILLGCVLALAVGPGFFMLINTSIKKGFIPAAMFATGILASDAMFAFLTYYGSSIVLDLKNMGSIIGISGGLLLMGFGAFNLFKEPVVKASNIEMDLSSKASFIDLLKGFSMNSLNPSVIIFWLGVVATISGHESSTSGTVQIGRAHV